ncbi:MAG: hypothetical protein M1834_005686 [Cirrosporium novae-zelandiae]|nr:MAG: hypothetical protein M1834_005686 [Cirrosporium novae-zelandiae]
MAKTLWEMMLCDFILDMRLIMHSCSIFLLLALAAQLPWTRAGGVNYSTTNGISTCEVIANGNHTDDVPNILKAFDRCGINGIVIFPEDQSYWIATRLNPIVNHVEIEWRGQWTFSDDLSYWRNNSYPVAFQNHRAGFIITGDNITINGYGTGGINGNGDTWYTAEAGDTQPGRPMPFVFWNVSDVTVQSFFVKQPPLWSINIMNGTNMVFDDIYCNATALTAPYGKNWVQNTDGFDTMDANNIRLTNFVYQGGDDCVAIKPRSYNIEIHNATCHGGNGMAIGSLGQYLEDASVDNIFISDVTVIRINEDLHNTAYIKTYMGGLVNQSSYESAGVPRGGGWGTVSNIVFSNFSVQGANTGPAITQDNGDDSNHTYKGTSKFQIRDVVFENITGWIYGTKELSISCSKVYPCYNIDVEGVHLTINDTGKEGSESCEYVASGGITGVNSSSCA